MMILMIHLGDRSLEWCLNMDLFQVSELLQFIQIQDDFMMILESSWQNMENKSWLKGQVSYQFHWDGRGIVLVIRYDKLVAKI